MRILTADLWIADVIDSQPGASVWQDVSLSQ